MSSDGSLFSVWHILSSLVPNKKRYFPLAGTPVEILLISYPHLFHIKAHAHIDLLLQHFQNRLFDALDLGNSLILLVLGIQVEIINRHRTDCLAVECLDVFDFSTYAPAF